MNADVSLNKYSLARVEQVRALILCTAVLCSATAFSSHFVSFLHPKEAVLAVTLVVLAITSCTSGLPQSGFRLFAALWSLAAFSLLVHVASGYAKVPAFSILELLRLATLLLIVAQVYDLLRKSIWRFYLRMSIILSALLVSLLGLLQYYGVLLTLFPVVDGYTQRIYSVFGNQDLFGGYLAIAIPLVIYGLRPSARAAWPLYPALMLLSYALMLSGSRSAWLAAGVGAGVVFGTSGIRKRGTLTVLGFIALTALLASVAAPEATINRITQTFKHNDDGLHARLWFWDGTVRMIRDNPIIGVGPGNYAYWSPSYLGEALHADGGDTHYHNELHTLHAHSDPLELFAETGLVGILCVALFLWPLRRCRGPEWGGLAALAVFAGLNATWQSPAHALVGLLLIACLLARREGHATIESPRSRARGWGVAGVSVCVALLTLGLTLVPSYRLSAARAEYELGNTSEMPFASIADTNWPNPAAQRDATIAHLARREYVQAKAYLVQARKGLDTGEVRFLEAVIAMDDRDLVATESALRACLWRWPAYLPAWELLLRILPPDTRQAERLEMRRWLSEADMSTLR